MEFDIDQHRLENCLYFFLVNSFQGNIYLYFVIILIPAERSKCEIIQCWI
ncbi:hypothetical protein HYC85_026650 [Camellia sinensis]|uniref:Uncharacterized protein n=1 Tax=Camellia sinensis TaxID=4442 RepID=A0A7J7G6D2_CAMSI|nr:hypothetical protein HYC85_026650 [Camellia sinensis]